MSDKAIYSAIGTGLSANKRVNSMEMTTELYVDGFGQHIEVHERNQSCVEGTCVIHNPSDHPMRNFPTLWRNDRGIMERICEHHVGHPDPDSLKYILETRGREACNVESVHGCDGCCEGSYDHLGL